METLTSFYADWRRRESREVRFGTGWRSSKVDGFEFVVFWIAATGELCLLRAPILDIQSDGFFRRFVLGLPPHFTRRPLRDDEVAVEVLVTVPEEELGRLLEGWQEHLKGGDGVEWIRAVVAQEYP